MNTISIAISNFSNFSTIPIPVCKYVGSVNIFLFLFVGKNNYWLNTALEGAVILASQDCQGTVFGQNMRIGL